MKHNTIPKTKFLPIKVIVFTYKKKISKTSAIAVNLEIFNFETFKFRLPKLQRLSKCASNNVSLLFRGQRIKTNRVAGNSNG